MNPHVDTFSYDDAIVRKFLWATFIWGLVGMLVGLWIALELANPAFNLGYNAIAVTLAMLGLLDPIVAAILMPVSSVTAIVGAWRSRTFARSEA